MSFIVMKKQLLLIVLLAFGWLTELSAQQNGPHNFSPQKFREEMEEYIILSTGMTALDAKNFFPLYHELHDKQRKINKEIMKLKRIHKNENPTEKECKECVERIMELKVESAELEQAYFKKMCKVVSPKKVHAVMIAEDKFYRRMLQNIPSNKRFIKLIPSQGPKK